MTLLAENDRRERQPLPFRAGEFNALQRKIAACGFRIDRLDQVDLQGP
ncbi:MAG: hypothetical protein WBO12_08430 [Xanthobacteraceae bacterium]